MCTPEALIDVNALVQTVVIAKFLNPETSVLLSTPKFKPFSLFSTPHSIPVLVPFFKLANVAVQVLTA